MLYLFRWDVCKTKVSQICYNNFYCLKIKIITLTNIIDAHVFEDGKKIKEHYYSTIVQQTKTILTTMLVLWAKTYI